MKFLKITFRIILLLAVIALIGLFFISQGNKYEVGLKNMELAPCPERPNCVTSFKNSAKSNVLTAIQYSEDLEPIQETIKKCFEQSTAIISETENYMHCEFKAGIWTDDVEFVFDTESNLIHFRSASRWGYADMNANQKRVRLLEQKLKNL